MRSRKVYASIDELLADKEVEIVDVAVYPAGQLEIVEKVTAAKRHLLCQKPFADEYRESRSQRRTRRSRQSQNRRQSTDALGRRHSLRPHSHRRRLARHSDLRHDSSPLQYRLEPLALDLSGQTARSDVSQHSLHRLAALSARRSRVSFHQRQPRPRRNNQSRNENAHHLGLHLRPASADRRRATRLGRTILTRFSVSKEPKA